MELLPILLVAEGEGFEPPEVLPSMVFKTTAIGRSAIPPQNEGERYFQRQETVNRLLLSQVLREDVFPCWEHTASGLPGTRARAWRDVLSAYIK